MRTTLAAALLAATLAPAAAAEFQVGYAISLGGFPIGEATLSASLDGTSYRTQMNARLTGLAGAFTSGKGGATSSGQMGAARAVPASFAVTSRSSSAQVQVRMGLQAGNVAQVEIAPPLEPRADRVPVEPGHKRGVVDPLSAVLMPVAGRGASDPANCNRTLPIFDGASRFDVQLTFAETREVEQGGYRGPVVVCNARYVPLAGHRSQRPGTKFMAENRDMQVWLAPVEGTKLLLPVRVQVATMLGMSVVEAQAWQVSPDGSARAQRRAGAE